MEAEAFSLHDVAPPRPRLWLAAALGKGNKLDEVVRAVGELGVSVFVPVEAARSVGGAAPLERWQRIADEAVCLAGRADRMVIKEPCTYRSLWPSSATTLVMDGSGQVSLRDVEHAEEIRLVIGPEGGFDKEELEFAASQGAKLAGLGGHTLRMQTASPAAVAAIQCRFGNLG